MKKRNFSFHFSKTRISAIMSEGYYHKGMIAHNSKKELTAVVQSTPVSL